MTARRTRKSVVRTAFQVIHTRRLWRHYGKAGADLVIAAVKHECGPKARISLSYFQWLKSRYLAQRMLDLDIDRIVKLTPDDKARLQQIRAKMRRQI